MYQPESFNIFNHSKVVLSDFLDPFEIGFWSVCLKTNQVIEFSRNLERIYGVSKAVFEQNPLFWKELIHKDDLATVLASQKELVKGTHITNKYRIITLDNEEKFLFDCTTPHIDENGHLIRLDGLIVDITNYRHTLAVTTNELNMIKFAVDQTNIVMITDTKGTITYVNDHAVKLSGYEREELLGENPKMFSSGNHPKEFYKEMWDTINSGQIWRGQICNRRKDGSLYWLSDSIVPFLNSDGEPFQFISLRRDITEQKKMRELIENNEKRIRSLLKYSNEGIGIIDQSGRFIYCSQSFRNIIGSTEDATQHQLLQAYIDKEDHLTFYQSISEALKKPKEPIIIEVHIAGRERKVECELVINNYLNEPNINGLVVNVRDITEKKAAQRKIEHIAYHDFLTGLKNRRYFEDQLACKLTEAKKNDCNFALVILDLDRFKFVNDTLGHFIGDILLKQLGERLNSLAEEGIIVARIGGDEFGIVVPKQGNKEELPLLLNRILALFKEPFSLEDLEFYITASIGVSVYPQCGEDVGTLMKNADIALHRVKDEGKNNYKIFDPCMDIDSYKKFSITNDLRKAIDRNELEIHYQPKIESATNGIRGAEALIRWKHPVWGYISPAEFIYIAEETRIINEIGDWVLEEVCKQMNLWKAKRIPLVPISINISPIQFLQPNLVEKIRTTLSNYKVSPELIEIELTETALLSNETQINNILEELRGMGIKIAIDDFGTGYSSLIYISKFKIDTLKIDQYFLKDIATERNSQQIIHAIIKLAHSLQMNIVVEGVETTDQLSFIKNYKNIFIQGYLFSKPLAEIQFEPLLRVGRCEPKEEDEQQARRERRRYFRIELSNPLQGEMTLLQIGNKMFNVGFTKILVENIGPGGLNFLTHINLPVRKDLLLKFRFLLMGAMVEVNGKIAWSKVIDGNIYHYGIEFVCSESEKDALIRQLNKCQVYLRTNTNLPESNIISGNKFEYLQKLING